jgi:hypothetical protein
MLRIILLGAPMNSFNNTFPMISGSSFARKAVLATALSLALGAPAFAQTTATTTATFEVTAINEISLSGTAPVLTINAAVAGVAPTPTTASQTYAVTTNETAKISAALDAAMPDGLTLTAAMAAPTGATSLSAVALTTTGQDLVTGISKLNEAGLALTYGLAATSAAGVVGSSNRVITYTITAI